MFTLKDFSHSYERTPVLEVPLFAAAQGEQWLVLGNSGTGKSTLLHVLGGLLRPTRGTVDVAGTAVHTLRGSALDQFRGRTIGVVFQQMHLLRTLTVAQNLAMAQYMAGLPHDGQRIHSVLERLDLAEKLHAYPHTLSFGQQQRVTIARAIMNRPKLLLADEPTSALDDVRSRLVLDLLIEQATLERATLVIATHDQRVKDRFEYRLDLNAAPQH